METFSTLLAICAGKSPYLLDGVSGSYLLKLVVLSLGKSEANGGIKEISLYCTAYEISYN